jgi:hypothetical protein
VGGPRVFARIGVGSEGGAPRLGHPSERSERSQTLANSQGMMWATSDRSDLPRAFTVADRRAVNVTEHIEHVRRWLGYPEILRFGVWR